MKKPCIALFGLLLLHTSSAWSEERQGHAEIHKVAMEFVQAKIQTMPGKVTYKVDEIDPRVSFPPCTQLEAFLPTGAQLQGKTSIGVRCNDKNGWSVFLPATITTTIDILISSRPLQQGQVVGAGDFNVQSGELNQPGTITSEAQILGKVLRFSIGAGQVLRQDMFRPPYVVTQGQTVQLIAEGRGIKLRTEGQALNNASEGQTAQVKVSSGQVINGVAKEGGIVEVRQ